MQGHRKGHRHHGYLEQLDHVAPAERFATLRAWMRGQPLALFAELRAKRPILHTDDAVLVARNVDIMEVLRLPTTFTVDLNKARMADHMLAEDETTLHQRDKGIFQALLSRDDLPRIRALVGALTDEALDAADGSIDLVPQCARWVPLRLVQDYFGLTGVDLEAMARWSRAIQLDAFFNQPFDARPDADAVFQASRVAYQELGAALGALMQRRGIELAHDPSADDIVARLLKLRLPAELGFTPTAMGVNLGGLLIGTVETAAKITAHALDQLLARPDALAQARAVAASDDHEAFAGFVWEGLRFAPFIPYLFRKCVRDHVLARGTRREAVIPAGATVLALTQSAMFDPELVDAPDEFRADRPYYVHSLHLGHGHHRCLGDHIARVMVPEMIRRVLLRSDVRATAPIDDEGGPFPEHFTLRYGAPRPG